MRRFFPNSFKASFFIFLSCLSMASTLGAQEIKAYDFWSYFSFGDGSALDGYLSAQSDDLHYAGRYTAFYPRGYEKDLSLRFWKHIIDPTEEASKQSKLKSWAKEAKLYLAFFNTPNQAHFRKKIAMANLSFSSMDGGVVDLHASSIPYLVDSITAARQARFHGSGEDGFSKRIAKTQDILISSLLDSDRLLDKNIADMLGYADSSALAEFQRPVFYEVLGTSLISSYKHKYITQGVELLAESLRLLDACESQDCRDALTLAPAYKIMTLLTLAEGYAMLGDDIARDSTLAQMRDEANIQGWPYLPLVDSYLGDIETLTYQWSQATQLELLGTPTGLKVPMTFVFKPMNACRLCHVGQLSVPESYLPD